MSASFIHLASTSPSTISVRAGVHSLDVFTLKSFAMFLRSGVIMQRSKQLAWAHFLSGTLVGWFLSLSTIIFSGASHSSNFLAAAVSLLTLGFMTDCNWNKLGLSCAKLSTRLASYARWANQSWSQLDCLLRILLFIIFFCQGHIPVEVVFQWGCFPVRLFSCAVVFL